MHKQPAIETFPYIALIVRCFQTRPDAPIYGMLARVFPYLYCYLGFTRSLGDVYHPILSRADGLSPRTAAPTTLSDLAGRAFLFKDVQK